MPNRDHNRAATIDPHQPDFRELFESRDVVAERQGFEPWIRFWRILTFQASAFDHSATAPHCTGSRAPYRGEGG